MKDLLPYYEAELQRMRASTSEFASKYPKIASRLQLSADATEDPHVERLIQSFALLASRVHKRLDDDFPQFTESLLSVLYPHYLRPFPSCSIAKFELGQEADQMQAQALIPRGTELKSTPVRKVACQFRTAYDTHLAPVAVRAVSYRHTPLAPPGMRLPNQASATLSVQFALTSPKFEWSQLGSLIRVFLDGDSSQVSWLREVLCHRVVAFVAQAGKVGSSAMPTWSGLLSERPSLVGFDDDQALIDFDERSHVAYRFLTEYFAFPEKFNFLDLPLPASALRALNLDNTATLTLHFILSGMRSDSDAARLLETVSEQNMALGCTPIVNLFKQNAVPISLQHTTTEYPVVVDARSSYGYEVYAINKVVRVTKSEQGETLDELRPFFSLHHEDLIGSVSGVRGETTAGGYWHVRRDELLATTSPGYEQLLTVVDVNFNPAQVERETLSLTVTATNRQLPQLLTFGIPGELSMVGGAEGGTIRMLRKPTRSHQFNHRQGNAWRLISHLSLNHLSLSGRGIDALKEMLHLYDLPQDPSNRKQVSGMLSVEFRPATVWMSGNPFASFVRGTEVRLSVDEDSYVGTGLGLFVAVLDRFFALYAHLNSFTQLIVTSSRSQQVLYTCPPRSGELTLV